MLPLGTHREGHAPLLQGSAPIWVLAAAPLNLSGSAHRCRALCRAGCNSPCSEISVQRWRGEDYPHYMTVIIKSIRCIGEMNGSWWLAARVRGM